MRQMISRPARALLPLAMAICAALFPDAAPRALGFFTALMLARGLSLAAGGALRSTAGSVVRASRLRGNLLTAAVMALVGGAAATAICMFDIPFIGKPGLWAGISGAAVNMSQVFADRMYTSNDRTSAAAYDIVIAVLTTVGLLVSGMDGWLMAVFTASAMAAGLLLLSGLKNGSSLQKGFHVLKFCPLALFKGWLFPAVITVSAHIPGLFDTDIAAAFLAIALLEFCEPAYRRSDEESCACSVWLPVISLVFSVACAVLWLLETKLPELNGCLPVISPFMAGVLPFACFGAMLTGLHLNVRRAIEMVLVALTPLTVISVLLAIPDMAALRRVARARKIQRKRR